MTVIDGATNNTLSVNVGYYPVAVAVNPVTNKIYVVNDCGIDSTCAGDGTVTVIDGAATVTTTVTVGSYPYGCGGEPGDQQDLRRQFLRQRCLLAVPTAER